MQFLKIYEEQENHEEKKTQKEQRTKGKEKIYEFEVGNTLLEILKAQKIFKESPCNGRGTCGKCKVRIVKGAVSPLGEAEKAVLTESEIKKGIRLSCFLKPVGDLVVDLYNTEKEKQVILTEGFMPKFTLNPHISKKKVYLTKPTLEHCASYEEILEMALGHSLQCSIYKESNLHILRTLPQAFEKGHCTALYLGGNLIGIEVGTYTESLYGVAIDIGTTTVVASLVELNQGKEIACENEMNPQKEYGLDVLSRIHFAKSEENGLKRLQDTMTNCINRLLSTLCSKNGISKKEIYEITIAANTTMMHFLLGVSTDALGKAPYATVFTAAQSILAASLGIEISPFGRVYCLPGVSSYIGADIVAGIAVSEVAKKNKTVLFIDIGTNGEIVLAKGGELCACSCAAGPALEGMNISCGMGACQGAIEKIQIGDKKIKVQVIGDKEPRGLCGSGILEGISELVRVKLIGKTGRLKKREEVDGDENLKFLGEFLIEEGKKRKFIVASAPHEISISQEDIRQVQLAKAAILSGFYALLDLMKIHWIDLSEVVIGGQFGKYLTVESLVGVGILPKEVKDKIRYIGNSSKTGALLCLLSSEVRTELENISKKINYVELSTTKGYERLFTKCLHFEEEITGDFR